MTSASNKLSVLSISDVHLGNRNTPAEYILTNLASFFNDFALKDNFDDLKLIVIAGDLWDDTIQFSSEHLPGFFQFWYKFTHWCLRKHIVLRVLEGTPKHDRLQGATIAAYTEVICPNLDFRYVKDLSIERLAALDTTVLYVPDECRPTAERCYQDVLDLMKEEQLSKVGIAVMHGMFKYQLGSIPMNAKVHDEELYLNLVEHFIVIGHIHTRSQYERIFAQGSFDRIAHGEPIPKGAWYFKYQRDKRWLPVFLENKNAKQYVTVEVSGTLEKALKKIDKEISDLPHGSYVRIAALPGHDIHQAFDEIRLNYPFFQFSKKVLKEEAQVEQAMKEIDYSPISLNQQTLTEAIFNEVNLRHELTPVESKKLYALLEEMHY